MSMNNKRRKKNRNIKNVSFNTKNIFSIVTTAFLAIAHILIIVFLFEIIRYYSMYPKVFNSLIVVILCLFVIIDIIFFVGFQFNDKIQKIIVCVLSILIIGGGIYGDILMTETNKLVEGVIDVRGEDSFETVSGVFVSYGKNEYTSIKELNGKKIGMLAETSEDSIASIGKQVLKDNNVDYVETLFNNNTDLLFALIGGEVDGAIMSSMYQAVFRADENVDYTQYVNEINEIEPFNKDIVVKSNTSRKDLSRDPFNVLLIGWSPVLGSETVGLADAIIVCTINPQTYTISMMSIARDSYVPISCYGGQCDKINSGRGTSMDCFVSTVEDLVHEEIDFYMEIDFAGFAELCGNIGGIEIDNPVSFELDGVYVPAGKYVADGWQTLEFCRERHHMPNGDFDRQQHQKEVIMKIAKKLLKHDLTYCIRQFDHVKDRVKTNLTLSQLSGVFNMLTATKNYTGLSLFKMLDMHALRITGYSDWHYNDSLELPLWIYRLYDGSISESLDHMQEVMGNYKEIKQTDIFYFNVRNPYVRDPFFSTSYDETEYHEELPDYYPNLTSMTVEEASEWAHEHGVELIIEDRIGPDDDRYVEELDGMVYSQSVPYGRKVEKATVCYIVIMGDGTISVKAPKESDYEGKDVDWAIEWCNRKGYEYKLEPVHTSDTEKNKELIEMSASGDKIIIKYYSSESEQIEVIDFSNYSMTEAQSWCNGKLSLTIHEEETSDNSKVGKLKEQSISAGTKVDIDSPIVLTFYKEAGGGTPEPPTTTCPLEHGTGGTYPDCGCDSGYNYDDAANSCVEEQQDPQDPQDPQGPQDPQDPTPESSTGD